MIAPAIVFFAALCLFILCGSAALLLIFIDQDDSKWWDHAMRWMRVSVALGIITGILTLLIAVVS